MIVFRLCECQTCEVRYAIAPDPYFPGQWIYFDRDKSMENATHVTIGGRWCIHGHQLETKCREAVMTENGDWIAVAEEHGIPSQN